MKHIVIPFKNQREATYSAIEMSYWCRDMGMERNVDYEWYFNSTKKEIYFRFFGEKESYATMFALRWAGHEI